MKKFLLVTTVLIGSFLLWNYAKSDKPPIKSTVVVSPTLNPSIVPQKILKQYLFIPYWSFGKTIDASGYDPLIYFGIGVNEKGIELNDKGYENLTKFVSLTPQSSSKILAIRMVDHEINSQVLKNDMLQQNIASQAVSLASKNKFDGVLLDYETSAFGFDSTTNKITEFYKLFSRKVHDDNLKFYVTLYGDTYFRARPYDVKQIGTLSDKVLIMAYDFSKSNGNPGPGFPLSGRDRYGYDFPKMIDDYQKDIPNEKLVVTLGYFGYDWRVDSKENSLAAGVPLSTGEITKEFITKCNFKLCSLSRVPDTSEPSIKYSDESGENHIVWFEDEISINKKKAFLKTRGIVETAVWAYSYY